MTAQLLHPFLGKIIGKEGGKVVSYLGIQYATLEHRFADAQLPSYPTGNEINATKYGYVATPHRYYSP